MVVGGINGRVTVTKGDIGCLFKVIGLIIYFLVMAMILTECTG